MSQGLVVPGLEARRRTRVRVFFSGTDVSERIGSDWLVGLVVTNGHYLVWGDPYLSLC